MLRIISKNLRKQGKIDMNENCMHDKNKPIRILVVGMHNKIGGVETFLMNYYRNIDKSTIQFDFINMYEELCFENEILKLGGKIYNVPNVKRKPIKYYKKLKKIIEDNKYNIVHINMLSAANILPVIAAKNAKVKNIITHSHNTNTPSGVIRKVLDKINKGILLKYSTDLWACSNLAGKWMFGNDREFKVINNAIDVEKYKFNGETRKKIRNKLNIENKFVIGHVGRFSYQKNHEFLIDTFYKIQKKRNDAYLLLIGEGELKEGICKKVNDFNINDKVLFLDTTDKIEDYLQAMDIFVLPSRFEGLPVTGVEAQANGLKCIFSSKITPEVKITDRNVFLDIDNSEQWVNYIANENIKYERNIDAEIIKKSGFDISAETIKLQNIYLEKIEK